MAVGTEIMHNMHTCGFREAKTMFRAQEQEREKVIDDVLVILQTLLKRTDTFQRLEGQE